MGKDRNGSAAGKPIKTSEKDEQIDGRPRKSRESSEEDDDRRRSKSRRKARGSSESGDERRVKGDRGRRRSRRRYSSSESESESDDSESSESESEASGSESESESESDGDVRRKRKGRREKEEEERERKRRKREKERKRRSREKEEERKKRKEKRKKKKMKEKKEKGKKGAVTDSWGKYGIIRETDMWNKRPEFTAWLAEVKQVNLEHLPNWEEKQMFKQFMEDHNTATFPSKKYYSLDAYYRHKMEKEIKRGIKKLPEAERTVFNDEEQRRQELMRAREKQKEQEIEALKRSMQSGMAQAMKEQAILREEMAYQYKIGNFEAAAAIQRRLEPDPPA